VKQKVSTVVKSAPCLALITDCWTSRSTDSYISVTSHFVDNKFNRQLAVLDTFLMYERYTAQNLLSKILSILEAWTIDKKYVTCLVWDNAANITAAVREGGFAHIGCTNHTMQLVINDSLGDEAIVDVLKSVRSIVGHFHRSATSSQLLNSVQTQLELSVVPRGEYTLELNLLHVTKAQWTTPCHNFCLTWYNPQETTVATFLAWCYKTVQLFEYQLNLINQHNHFTRSILGVKDLGKL